MDSERSQRGSSMDRDQDLTEPLIPRSAASRSLSPQTTRGRTPAPGLLHSLRHRKRLIVAMLLTTSFAALLVWTQYATRATAVKHRVEPDIGLPPHIYENLAMYSPYFPAGRYETAPKGCSVSQVNIIQRHGARYPTASAGQKIASAVAKLKAIPTYTDSRFDFIHSYTYDLGADNLLPFGAVQSYDSGAEVYERYPDLVTRNNMPFVRASSGQRVVESANNWTAGFAAASHGKFAPALSVVLDEARNDTLDGNMCSSAGSSDAQQATWLAASSPLTAARIAKAAPGVKLTDVDVNSLESLCGFDSLAKERKSPWCEIFEREDFEAFEYYGDINKYYIGPGQELSPVQGVGYINELLARLTRTAVKDATQTNSTLDSDPASFPLDRSIYADFSHDNQMIAIYAAIGLYDGVAPLSLTRATPKSGFVVSQIVPFGGRLVTEKLECGKSGKGGQEYVRMFINDARMSMEFCGKGDGICELGAFVESQGYARRNGDGDWEKCFQ